MTDEPVAGLSNLADRDATSSDDVLVARLRRGDEAAFVEIIDRHAGAMLRVAGLYCTTSVAEEVVQETWLGVLNGLDRFEGRASLRTWIFRILANIARTKGVREHRQIPFSAFADPLSEPAESSVDPERFLPAGETWAGHWVSYPRRWEELPEERFLSTESTDAILASIETLPPAQREVVTLRDIEGWSSEEVCEALAISAGNQRILLHRGRSKVRLALERMTAAPADPGKTDVSAVP
jgi:RNA polymerase sigma-70 factor (ECF subfamily)